MRCTAGVIGPPAARGRRTGGRYMAYTGRWPLLSAPQAQTAYVVQPARATGRNATGTTRRIPHMVVSLLCVHRLPTLHRATGDFVRALSAQGFLELLLGHGRAAVDVALPRLVVELGLGRTTGALARTLTAAMLR